MRGLWAWVKFASEQAELFQWRVRNAAGVAGRSGSVASDRGNAWLVRALLGGKFARHRGSQNLYYLSHPAP